MRDTMTELELSILSNMIQRMPVYMQLSQYPSDIFEIEELGIWFDAVKECYAAHGSCDLISLMSVMDGNLPIYTKWLSRVSAAQITVATIDQHIDAMLKLYNKRLIDRACRKALDAPTADEARTIIDEGILTVDIGGKDDGELVSEIAEAGIDRLTISEELIATRFAPIDRQLRGFGRGELIIIGGYAKSGKTTLALQIATDMSLAVRTNYYSLEMTRPEVFRKMLSRKASIPTDLMSKGRMTPDVQSKLTAAIDAFKSGKNNFKIIDNLYNIDEILGHARMSYMRDDMRVMVVDYLQLCDSHFVKGEQRYLTVGKMTRKLKQFAQQTGVRVIVLSQMTGDENEKPGGSNFRESGNIFMDANIPLITWWDKKNDRNWLIIERNRRTAPADCEIIFEGVYSRFRDAYVPEGSWTETNESN